MIRIQHRTVRRMARRLRPSAASIAAAAALPDAGLLLQLNAAQRQRPVTEPMRRPGDDC